MTPTMLDKEYPDLALGGNPAPTDTQKLTEAQETPRMLNKLFGIVPDVHEDPPLEVLTMVAGPGPKIPPIGLPPTAVH